MNDNNLSQDDTSVSGMNYADAYQPPSDNQGQPTRQPVDQPNALPNDQMGQSASQLADQSGQVSAPQSVNQPTSQSALQPNVPLANNQPTSAADMAQPQSVGSAQSKQAKNNNVSESLEDQNIFFLLGVNNGTDQQKEAFLDELQQVIWEDFLEYDVKLLITSDELKQLQSMMQSDKNNKLEQQEKTVVFLEEKIPDLEAIMLEKALELKEEMVRERAAGLRTYHADKPGSIKRLDEAEQLMNENKWYSAAHVMNSLSN